MEPSAARSSGGTRSSLDRLSLDDTTQLPEFNYQGITGASDIRVLHLHPGTVDDAVSCHLEHVPLDTPPSYEAISYCWGDPSNTREICCGGGLISITVRLHSALQHLRFQDKNRVLWADALCINQADMAERSSQVSWMGDIYSKAERTLVWLGEETDDVKDSFDAIKKGRTCFPDRPPTSYDSTTEILEESRNWIDLAEHEALFSSVVDWTPIVNLLRRPWFLRKWVIQEVVKARESALICGNQQLNFATLEEFVVYLKVLKDSFTWEPLTRDLDATLAFDNLYMIFLIRINVTTEVPNLADILTAASGFLCTDPRDHVIGILGLLDKKDLNSRTIKPDYTVPSSVLFRRATQSDISNRNSLELLSAVNSTDQDLPSWVPDFSKRIPSVQTSLPAFFNATYDTGVSAVFTDQGTTLSLSGKLFDTISVLGMNSPAPASGLDHFNNTLSTTHTKETWTTWLLDSQNVASERALSMSPSRFEEFARTLCWDISPYLDRIGPELPRTYKEYFEFLDDMRDVPSSQFDYGRFAPVRDIEANMTIRSTGRRFCRSAADRLGCVPPATEVGDRICVLFGGSVPYVVRPCGEDGCYKFIGDCYLHGVMDGEVMDMEAVETETIVLK